MTTKGRFVLLLPLFLLCAVGCSKGKSTPASVSGKVTLKDQPVTGGTVTFHFENDGTLAGTYRAEIGTDGTYGLTSLPAGEAKVSIETESINTAGRPKPEEYGKRRGRVMKSSPAPSGVEVGKAQTKYMPIPRKYADPKTSGLTVTLTKGKQEKNFPLAD